MVQDLRWYAFHSGYQGFNYVDSGYADYDKGTSWVSDQFHTLTPTTGIDVATQYVDVLVTDDYTDANTSYDFAPQQFNAISTTGVNVQTQVHWYVDNAGALKVRFWDYSGVLGSYTLTTSFRFRVVYYVYDMPTFD